MAIVLADHGVAKLVADDVVYSLQAVAQRVPRTRRSAAAKEARGRE